MLGYLRTILATRDDRGASAVEYALLVAGVAVVLFAVIPALGFTVRQVFEEQNSQLCEPLCSSVAP